MMTIYLGTGTSCTKTYDIAATAVLMQMTSACTKSWKIRVRHVLLFYSENSRHSTTQHERKSKNFEGWAQQNLRLNLNHTCKSRAATVLVTVHWWPRLYQQGLGLTRKVPAAAQRGAQTDDSACRRGLFHITNGKDAFATTRIGTCTRLVFWNSTYA